jgi:uncharacterized protein (TIGR03437 family)
MRRISLLLLTLAPCLLGYIRLTTGETTPVALQRVDNTGIQFYLNSQIMPGATSSASGKTVTVITANSNPSQAIASAQAMWNNVTTANVKFLPVMPTTVTHATQDPNNLINVISIAASTAELSAVNGVVALTLNTWYSSSGVINGLNVNDGSIVNSDILLNPADSFSTDGSTATTDLQAVMTHEFGHTLGANHTGVLGATMFQFWSLTERYLSLDDLTFVNEAYPTAGTAAAPLGTIGGTVMAGTTPVPYALLTLIDTTQNITIGGLSNPDGTYSVQVPPGSYIISAAPFNTIIQPGNLYFTTAQAALAAGVSFQPTFLGGNTNPSAVKVSANGASTGNIINVASGASTLTPPFYIVLKTGAAFTSNLTVSQIGGPVPIASGQTVDLCLVGTGFDSTFTTANFAVYGSGITITKVAVDPLVSFPIGPLLRVTLNIPAQSTANLATLFVTKGGNTLSLAGGLVITPPTPAFTSQSVVSAATYVGSGGNGAVSPGGIYSIYATTGTANLGPNPYVVNGGYVNGFLPGDLAGVNVTFDGVSAPLFFVYGGQINLQVPFEVAGKTSTNVVVNFFGSTNPPVAVPVLPEQPAFFTATPEGSDSLVYNADGTLNSMTNPAARGTYVTAYGTGVGNLTGLVTGQGAPFVQALNYTCTIGSQTEAAAFAGWTPTAVGLAQFNFEVPTSITANSTQTLKCTNTDTASGASTQTGTIYVGN